MIPASTQWVTWCLVCCNRIQAVSRWKHDCSKQWYNYNSNLQEQPLHLWGLCQRLRKSHIWFVLSPFSGLTEGWTVDLFSSLGWRSIYLPAQTRIWVVIQLLSKLSFSAAPCFSSAQPPVVQTGSGSCHPTTQEPQGAVLAWHLFPQPLPSVGNQEHPWSSRDLHHGWGEVGGPCSGGQADILPLLENELLRE